MTGNTSKDQCLTPWSSISGKAEIIEVKRQYKSCVMHTTKCHFVKYNKTAFNKLHLNYRHYVHQKIYGE